MTEKEIEARRLSGRAAMRGLLRAMSRETALAFLREPREVRRAKFEEQQSKMRALGIDIKIAIAPIPIAPQKSKKQHNKPPKGANPDK